MAACLPLPPFFQERRQSEEHTSGVPRTQERPFRRECAKLTLVFNPHARTGGVPKKTFSQVGDLHALKYPSSFHMVKNYSAHSSSLLRLELICQPGETRKTAGK